MLRCLLFISWSKSAKSGGLLTITLDGLNVCAPYSASPTLVVFIARDGLDVRVPSLLHTYTPDLFSGVVWNGYLHVKCVASLLSFGLMAECVRGCCVLCIAVL